MRSMSSSSVNPAAPARAANSPAICPSWRSRSAVFFSGFLLADESSRALVSFQQAAKLQFAIGAHHRVRIDREIDCELANGGELVAGAQRSGRDSATDLVDELTINGNTAMQVDRELNRRGVVFSCHAYQCTIVLVQYVKRNMRAASYEVWRLQQDLYIQSSSVSLLCGLEAFAPLFAVAMQGVEDDGVGFGRRADLIHLDGFAFQLLVVLKEAAKHDQAMRRHF